MRKISYKRENLYFSSSGLKGRQSDLGTVWVSCLNSEDAKKRLPFWKSFFDVLLSVLSTFLFWCFADIIEEYGNYPERKDCKNLSSWREGERKARNLWLLSARMTASFLRRYELKKFISRQASGSKRCNPCGLAVVKRKFL